jgi:hypothetical protein
MMVRALSMMLGLLCGQAAHASVEWESTCLTGTVGCSSFTMQSSGAYSFVAAPGAPPLTGLLPFPPAFNVTHGPAASALGAWEQLDVGPGCSVRYYPQADAFVFSRVQRNSALPWPRFQFTQATDERWGVSTAAVCPVLGVVGAC